MENKIKYSSFFEDDGGLDDPLKKLTALVEALRKLGEEKKQKIINIDPKDTEQLAKYYKEVKELRAEVDKLKKAKKEIQKVRKKATELTKQELIQAEKERKASRERTAIVKQSVIIRESEKNSIEQLRAKLKLVTIAWEKLTTEETLNTTRGKRVIASKEKLTAQLKTLQKVEESTQKTKKKAIDLTNKELIARERERKILRERNLIAKQVAIIRNSERNSIEQLRARLSLVTIAWRKLTAEETLNTKNGKRVTAQKLKLTAQLKRLEQATGDHRRQVGNYTVVLEKLKRGLSSFAAATGLILGFRAVISVVRNVINIFSSFEKENSKLQAILQYNRDEMTGLKDDAKLLGSTTKFTANEVTKLQIELAKLGFPEEDIRNMARSTLDAATAMGSELAEQAKLTGATLKIFNLDSRNTAEANDLLSKSTISSALDFSKLSTAIANVGPVANTFGFSLKDTLVQLGVLADAGFDASASSTALRNIILNLADSTKKLGARIKEPVHDIPSLVKGLKQLKAEGIDLTGALGLVDKRSVAAFTTLLNGTDNIEKLNNRMQEFNGTAEEMAEAQLDNLQGAFLLLKSAWEGFILSVEDGNGSIGTLLKGLVRITTEVLNLLTGSEKLEKNLSENELKIRNVAKAVITYSKVLGGIILNMFLFNKLMRAGRVLMKAYEVSTKLLGIRKTALSFATRRAIVSMKLFNETMRANPIGTVLTLISGLVTVYYLLAGSIKSAGDEQKRYNKIREDAKEDENEKIEARNAELQEEINALRTAINYRKSKGEEGIKLEQEFSKKRLAIIEKEKKETEIRIENIQDKLNTIRDYEAPVSLGLTTKKGDLEIIDKTSKILGTTVFQSENLNNNLDKYLSAKSAKKIARNNLFTVLSDYSERLKANKESLKEINKELIGSETELNNATNEVTKAQQKRVKELETLRKRLIDLRNEAINRETLSLKEITITKYKREIEAIKGNSEIEKALKIELAKRLNDELRKIDYKARADRRKEEIKEFKAEATYKQNLKKLELLEQGEFEAKSSSLISKEKISSLKEELKKNEELYKSYQADIAELELEGKNRDLTRVEVETLDNLKKDQKIRNNILAIKIKILETTRKTAKAEIEQTEKLRKLENDYNIIEANKLISAQEDIINKKGERITKADINLLRDRYKQRYKLQVDAINKEYEIKKAQVAKETKLYKILEQEQKNALASLSNNYQNTLQGLPQLPNPFENIKNEFQSLVTQITDEVEQLYQNLIDSSKDRLDKQNEIVDAQRERAKQGLSNTLAFEQKESAKRESELIASERRLERIQKVKALYSAYTSNANNSNVKNPLAKTLRDFAVLQAITATFSKGGYTGEGQARDVSGLVHKKEFVIDAPTTKQLGLKGYSMDDFKNRFLTASKDYKFSTPDTTLLKRNIFKEQSINFEKATSQKVQLANVNVLAKEIRELKEFQMNKKEQIIDVRQLIDGTLEFSETIRSAGNEKKYRHILKKEMF